MDKCYRCEEPGTSAEHVPPKCLFPTRADIPEKDYRINLITVPSCDLHNTAKSMDDEFLMVSLAGIIGNNSIGYLHKFGKVERALRRRSYKLLDKVILNKQIVHRIPTNNGFLEVLWGTPDIKRLHNCLQNIAYALHFYHFKSKFKGTVKSHFGYLHYSKGNSATWNEFITKRAEIDLKGKSYIGSNPDVFKYMVSDTDKFGLYIIKLCFYGGLSVYVVFIPEGKTVPENPAMQFLNAGIPAVITLHDEKFHFEPKHQSSE